jgi:hypothetical protein
MERNSVVSIISVFIILFVIIYKTGSPTACKGNALINEIV